MRQHVVVFVDVEGHQTSNSRHAVERVEEEALVLQGRLILTDAVARLLLRPVVRASIALNAAQDRHLHVSLPWLSLRS